MTGQIGESAKAAIEALKSTPMVLALLIFNVIFMLLSVYANTKGRETLAHIVEIALQACKPQ